MSAAHHTNREHTVNTTKITAFIPTAPSALYETFGLDFVIPAVWDPETGDCVTDADYIEWVEVGPFGDDDWSACDPNCDSAVRDRLDAAAKAAGYGLDWPTYRETAAEYHEVDAYRLDRRGRRVSTDQAPAPQRGRGRPKIGEKITLAFPRDLTQMVDAAAAAAWMSRSGWVRRACAEKLARTAKEDKS